MIVQRTERHGMLAPLDQPRAVAERNYVVGPHATRPFRRHQQRVGDGEHLLDQNVLAQVVARLNDDYTSNLI